MPEKSPHSHDRHKALLPAPGSIRRRQRRPGEPAYAELLAASNFSFLRGASHPDELVIAAKALGLAALGIADRNSLAGAVRAHVAAKEAGLRLVLGVGRPQGVAGYAADQHGHGQEGREPDGPSHGTSSMGS